MSFFFRNAAGMLLQLYPCILLTLLPFPHESFRFPKKSVFIGATVYALLLSLAFPAALAGAAPLFSADLPEGVSLAGNVLFMLSGLVSFLGFLWIVRDAAIKKLLVFLLVVFYAAAQYWLVNLFLPFLPFGQEGEAYSLRGLVLYAATAAFLLPIVILTAARPVHDFLREVEPDGMHRELRIEMLVTVAFVLLMVYSASVQDFKDPEDSLVFCPLFLFLILSQCMIYWLLFRETLLRKRDSEMQRTMEIHRVQSEKIAHEVENANRMRHDMRHHLNVLYATLGQGETEKAKEYLETLIYASSDPEEKTYCRNFTVNTLLQYYAGLARDKGIPCEIQAECGDVTVSAADLTVIFGNAMENSIQACAALPEEERRWISVRVGVMHSSLVVEIRNPCHTVYLSGKAQGKHGFLPAESFRSGRKGGGFGLRSLKYTAEKYGGDAGFCFDDAEKVFTARIRLNLHPELL